MPYYLRCMLTIVFCSMILGDCGPRVGGLTGSSTGKKYSEPPLYAGASDVQKSRSGGVQTTTYTTTAAPKEVYDFYFKALVEQGWEFREETAEHAEYGILTTGPAFSLYIRVTSADDDLTHVQMEQILSGPFDWPEP